MSQGLYEILGVADTARVDEIKSAYQDRLAELVRRLRAARRQGGDVVVLEAQERTLRESMEILSDPARRRRYDAFRTVSRSGLPTTAEELWSQVGGNLADPAAAAAATVVRALTELPLGDAPAPARPERPEPRVQAGPAPAIPAPQVPPPRPAVQAAPPRPATPGAAPPPRPAGIQMPPPPRPVGVAGVKLQSPVADKPKTPDLAALAERHGFDGRYLRAAREAKGFTLDDVTSATRISQRYLVAIEENGYERLPAATFVRGYLKEIARVLGLKEQIVNGYMELFSAHRN